ncbi:ComF family protein [Sphingobacterium faecium]|jgi:ComF family protein|uniref:ComF family protein n=1 Tax=Sphingobacterium faecium TaxID=34087 RepID=UPI0004E5EF48|nr:phosphoribosyltransferase family protein [Sphingobacterium faecium]CDT02303.1 putative competence protein F [Sphingobacterium sp. PM2-P1-29]SJN33632.1 Competence protein F homolog, phosphoribosyltransferase domain; protein YhgH required for utilization of DNA as sole source of carbon and energy [Sphingobacterium faecium PCAi_F2.5]HCU45057.1 ComF family protein [Sphingobacterium sp.]UXD68971.1 ComF family protein [Sphingobacterium faecium]WGQ16684.1 phosphoribosyltransferase family protein [
MKNRLLHYLSDFSALFFPKICAGCGHILVSQEKYICTSCLFHLPITNFHLDSNNQVARQLWGKFPFEHAAAMFLLRRKSRVERILYQIKYANQPQLAYFLGKQYGETLAKSNVFTDVDVIIPIPLHKNKLNKRGYNQSFYLAKGIGMGLSKPILEHGLIREKDNISQTKKSRLERYDNVLNVFMCPDQDRLRGKHVLLVDDVLTTGATLTAAAEQLVAAGCILSVLTLARA